MCVRLCVCVDMIASLCSRSVWVCVGGLKAVWKPGGGEWNRLVGAG